jgi:hypothetical protein
MNERTLRSNRSKHGSSNRISDVENIFGVAHVQQQFVALITNISCHEHRMWHKYYKNTTHFAHFISCAWAKLEAITGQEKLKRVKFIFVEIEKIYSIYFLSKIKNKINFLKKKCWAFFWLSESN